MGYNRAGARAKQKARRRRKEERRLTAKAAPPPAAKAPPRPVVKAAPQEPPGLLGKVKQATKQVAAAVGGAVETVKEKVTGKGEKKSG
jgi:hypothetical protein